MFLNIKKRFRDIFYMLEKVYDLDVKATNRLRMDTSRSGPWKLITFLAHSGDSWFWVAGLIIVWIFNRTYHKTSAFLIISIVILAAVVMGIKLFVRRKRPDGEWGTIYRNTDPHSFPSGHAARASMLGLFSIVLGPVWLAIFMVVWAILVCLSRVMTGMHYLSDILAGMLLGLFSGSLLLILRPFMEILLPFLF
jgi:membrane-associated phospholipid phosphatase